jgi:hypothetical protein
VWYPQGLTRCEDEGKIPGENVDLCCEQGLERSKVYVWPYIPVPGPVSSAVPTSMAVWHLWTGIARAPRLLHPARGNAVTSSGMAPAARPVDHQVRTLDAGNGTSGVAWAAPPC